MSKEKISQKTSFISGVVYRLLFLMLIPVFVLIFVFASIMLVPYWIATNKIYFNTKHIQGSISWWYELID